MWSLRSARMTTSRHRRFAQSQSAAARLSNARLEQLESRLALACVALPTTVDVRGKLVDFDKCYATSFTDSGVSWAIQVYYTESNSTANTSRCTGSDAVDGDADGVPDRCEHALPNIDDADGNNVEAVAMANEVMQTLQFYVDRDLKFVPTGTTEVNAYIAEDPRGGGIVGTNGLYCDDELVADPDDLWKRVLAIHEMQHMVQKEYDTDGVNWTEFGEGTARASEDRFDTTMDADTGRLFIPQINKALALASVRTADLLTLSYDQAAWWTWYMDQYRTGTNADPPVTDTNDIGWDALRDLYQRIEDDPANIYSALKQAIADQGGSFTNDFIDYTLALYAHQYNPSDPRLDFLDAEILSSAVNFAGHRLHTTGPTYASDGVLMSPRSSEYWEFNPASTCDYTAFSFDGLGYYYGFTIMTVDGGTLQNRWTSISETWSRTVRTKDLDRIVGVVTALDGSGSVNVGHGCVTPTVNILSPTTSNHQMVGRANNPRTFITRLDVTGNAGDAVSGLTAADFKVELIKAGSLRDTSKIPATVINAAYVQDDYWLLVQAPDEAAGAETGEFYDLIVTLGTKTDTEPSSILYVEKTQDVVIVLDHSGSMGGTTGKIEAARNAATLLVEQLADDDQGAYIAFDSNASLRESLATMGSGTQRADLLADIAAELPGTSTSIGDGMNLAATEHDLRGIDINACSFVLLSDGMENEPQYWADVQAAVADNDCQIHTIALGPATNQELMQSISGASSAGGSYYYATNEGSIPVNSTIGWQNNLSRIYDSIATDVAGRQRVVTAIRESSVGGSLGGLVTFDDLKPGTTFGVGETVKSNGVEMTGKPFYYAGGQTTSDGRAYVRNTLKPGVNLDLSMGAINVEFDFGGRANSVSLVCKNSGLAGNLRVNGELVIFNEMTPLHGTTIGGVAVSITPLADGVRLDLNGAIDQFSIGGQDFAFDEVEFKGDGRIQIPVDDSSDELFVSVAWQTSTGGTHATKLYDPDDNLVPTSHLRRSSRGTNDLWRVPAPKPGIYRLAVQNLPQEFFVTGSLISRYELQTFLGTTFEDRDQGTPIPIVASFIGNGAPLLGATVLSTVTAPDGLRQTIKLHDDGNHGDSQPGDGIYANTYFATSLAAVDAPPPSAVIDGAEPESIGSYTVNTVATKADVRREAQDAFVIVRGADADLDGLPDDFEKKYGIDTKSPEDGRLDPDMDGLSNRCEYQAGTNPQKSDTDDGGESDGSEVTPVLQGRCRVDKQDPRDPSDDRVPPLDALLAIPEATSRGVPFMHVVYNAPEKPTRVELVRQAVDSRGAQVEPWTVIQQDLRELVYADTQVRPNLRYQYKAMPSYSLPAEKVTLDFAAFTKGQTINVGKSLVEDQVTMTGEPFYVNSLTPITSGSALVGDALQLGSGQDLQLRSMTVGFDFSADLTGLSLLYNSTQGALNVTINGERRIVPNFSNLDGETVGGVLVERTAFRGGYQLSLLGTIRSFSIGGQSLVIDDVIGCYRDAVEVAGGNLLTPFVTAVTDPYAPEGTIQINRGDLTTKARNVQLLLTASDSERESHGTDGEQVVGVPNSKLTMQLSNSPDFKGAAWVPFASVVNWQLDPQVPVGKLAFVYARFRDVQENISKSLIVDSIRLETPSIPGDVNLDGTLNAADIDAVCQAAHGKPAPGNADLDGNGTINADDHAYIVTRIFRTSYGDANLDLIFNSSDLVDVFIPGQYEDKTPGNSTWATGDWDCDGDFTTGDLVLAFQKGSYSPAAVTSDSRVPSTHTALVAALVEGRSPNAGERADETPASEATADTPSTHRADTGEALRRQALAWLLGGLSERPAKEAEVDAAFAEPTDAGSEDIDA